MTDLATALLLGVMSLPAIDVNPGALESCREIAGYVEMQADGSLVIQRIESGINEHIAPGSRTYASNLAIFGPLSPGERKPYMRFMGYARMGSDGVIHLFWGGRRTDEGFILEPRQTMVRPEDPEYHSVVDRLGGIVPGGVRGIPASRCPPAQHAPGPQR